MEFGVQAVLNVLRKVEFSIAHWKELGNQLKPDLDLKGIAANNKDAAHCLEVVIERWYKDGDDPSWETLAAAVKMCPYEGGKNVAAKIRKMTGGTPGTPPKTPVTPPSGRSEGQASGTVRPDESGDSEPTIVETGHSNRGLAILVTCDYAHTARENQLLGTNDDAREMEKNIKELEYHKIQLNNQDATKSEIKLAIENIPEDCHLSEGTEDKVIIFVFSGHGDEEDKIISQEGEELCLHDDIVRPLLAKRKTSDIPVLFFIDACRGRDKLVPKFGSKQPKFAVKGLIKEVTNYRIDYATISHHEAYEVYEVSGWLSKIACKIRDEKDESLQNIMAAVQQKVSEEFPKRQQPNSFDSLSCGPLYLHPKHSSSTTM